MMIQNLTTATDVMPILLDSSPDCITANDRIYRVKKSNERLTITIRETQTIRDDLNAYIDKHMQEIDLLCSVIIWQKKTIDYQALHTAFLLNSLSEEDFEKESEKFIVHRKKISPREIAGVIGKLDQLIRMEFDTSDYADYFQCTQDEVINGLRLLPDVRFQKMLPQFD